MIAFSGVGIKNFTDTTKLPERVGRLVATDLIRYDSLQAEHKILRENYAFLFDISIYKDNLLRIKDSILNINQQTIKDKDEVIKLQLLQIDNYKAINKDLEYNVKVYKRKNNNKVILIGSIIALATAAFILK